MGYEDTKEELRRMLRRGVATHYWVTRNYRVRNWDDTEEWVRLMYPPAAGVAQVELPGRSRDEFGEERRTYQTMDADHFCDSIVDYH